MKLNKLTFALILGLFLTANFSYAAELVPNDPDYHKQWYLSRLNMPKVWAQETGKRNIVIAVIDSGVDISHPDLHDNIWVNQKEIWGDGIDNDNNGYIDDINGWDFILNNNDPRPKYDRNCFARNTCIEEAILHGTMVAGVAAAIGNNSMGISGVSWQAKIMPLRVLSQNGSGNTADVVAAINYAVDNGADIINLSFVGDTYDRVLEKALQRAFDAGLVIVVAAGNVDVRGQVFDLDVKKMYPVCHKGDDGTNIIIGVGATDKKDKLAEFSSYGSSCVDIMAPGEDFWGTLVFDANTDIFSDYYGGWFSGTSLAAPVVSGIAALIKANNSNLSNIEIRDLILNNADNIDAQNPKYEGKLGRGLINPVKIFQSLKILSGEVGLIKGSGNAVYYKAMNGKRYVFPSQETYLSWYRDFEEVAVLSDTELAQMPLGGNVTMKPGVKLVKIQTDPKVYAVSHSGVLRWIKTEDLARHLYGDNWQQSVIDLSDAFFVNYQLGEPIENPFDYDPVAEKNQAISIDHDKGLLNN